MSASIGGAGSARSIPIRSLVAPTIFTIFGAALLLGLGTWQVQRLHWKEGLIAERHAAVSAPPVPLPNSLAEARPLDFRHVAVTGRYRADHEFDVFATPLEGDGAGFDVITPLERADGSFVLINRGFVPSDRKPAAGQAPAGDVTVSGLLRLAPTGKPSSFTPDNQPARGQWYYVDVAAMAAAAGIAPVLPFYVDADASPDGGYPQGGQTPLDLPNNHLQYAITWYALAAALIIFYIVLVRRHRRPGAA